MPTADQLVPSHLAMRWAGTPPADVNRPPAYNASPLPSSKVARAKTSANNPMPTADQLVPSHLAMRWAGTPPADVNSPPAYNASPLPSSKVARAKTLSFIPLPGAPTADQVVPSHLAMR